MQPIKFQCSSCGQSLEAPHDMAGSNVECPKCKKSLLVPHAAQGQSAAKAIAVTAICVTALALLLSCLALIQSRQIRYVPVAGSDPTLASRLNELQTAVAALQQKSNASVKPNLSAVEDRLSKVERQVALQDAAIQQASNAAASVEWLTQQFLDLSSRNSRQAMKLIEIEGKVGRQETCSLDPTQPGPFGTIFTSCGMFFVSLKNVEPYLNGVKVHVEIGNPMMSSYNGATLNVTYGPPFDGKRMFEDGYYDQYQKSLAKTSVRISDRLEAGRWNTTTFVLAPIDPRNFGTLELGMTTDNLTLRVPYQKEQ